MKLTADPTVTLRGEAHSGETLVSQTTLLLGTQDLT